MVCYLLSIIYIFLLINFYIMNNIDFKVGDVVCLKSGGPSMTVEEIGEYFGTSGTHVKCT